jgi:hypothetical protein
LCSAGRGRAAQQRHIEPDDAWRDTSAPDIG